MAFVKLIKARWNSEQYDSFEDFLKSEEYKEKTYNFYRELEKYGVDIDDLYFLSDPDDSGIECNTSFLNKRIIKLLHNIINNASTGKYNTGVFGGLELAINRPDNYNNYGFLYEDYLGSDSTTCNNVGEFIDTVINAINNSKNIINNFIKDLENTPDYGTATYKKNYINNVEKAADDVFKTLNKIENVIKSEYDDAKSNPKNWK